VDDSGYCCITVRKDDECPMELKSSILFYLLIRAVKPRLICDIGSLDGTNALYCRRFSPHSKIIAFEANPYNANKMRANKALSAGAIQVENVAVSNNDGQATFYIESQEGVAFNNGISSLRRRLEEVKGGKEVSIPTVRLDTYIKSRALPFETIALWVDVEGLGYEVLAGILGIKENVSVIHVETETAVFWRGQKLKPEVELLLKEMGFTFLGRGMPEEQHNIVYINNKLFERSPFRFRLIRSAALCLSFLKSTVDRIIKKNEN
jgi:FkbM family methyltransferase